MARGGVGRSNSNGSSDKTTSIHISALDGIVNVNSLFTLAVFIGLQWNPSDPTRNFTDDRCSLSVGNDRKLGQDMVTYHVLSFSSFLFSSLIALCLKQAVRIRCGRHHHKSQDDEEEEGRGRSPDAITMTGRGRGRGRGRRIGSLLVELEGKVFPSVHKVNKLLLRAGIVASAAGSLSGSGCLMLALVNAVQIKLGALWCSAYATAAIVPLVLLIPAAMLAYIYIIFSAFVR